MKSYWKRAGMTAAVLLAVTFTLLLAAVSAGCIADGGNTAAGPASGTAADTAPGTGTSSTDTPNTDTPNTDTTGTASAPASAADTPGTDTPGTDTPDKDAVSIPDTASAGISDIVTDTRRSSKTVTLSSPSVVQGGYVKLSLTAPAGQCNVAVRNGEIPAGQPYVAGGPYPVPGSSDEQMWTISVPASRTAVFSVKATTTSDLRVRIVD